MINYTQDFLVQFALRFVKANLALLADADISESVEQISRDVAADLSLQSAAESSIQKPVSKSTTQPLSKLSRRLLAATQLGINIYHQDGLYRTQWLRPSERYCEDAINWAALSHRYRCGLRLTHARLSGLLNDIDKSLTMMKMPTLEMTHLSADCVKQAHRGSMPTACTCQFEDAAGYRQIVLYSPSCPIEEHRRESERT